MSFVFFLHLASFIASPSLSLPHINNRIAETCPVYTRPECKERSSMRARSLPLVWDTGNCRSLSFGSSLDPLRLTRGLTAAGEFLIPHRPQLRAGFAVEICSLGNWFRLRPPKIEHVLSTTCTSIRGSAELFTTPHET